MASLGASGLHLASTTDNSSTGAGMLLRGPLNSHPPSVSEIAFSASIAASDTDSPTRADRVTDTVPFRRVAVPQMALLCQWLIDGYEFYRTLILLILHTQSSPLL